MNRCSFCEWIPILPWPVWPLAGHARLGQNTVVGSMTILLSWLCWGACQEEVCLDPRFLCNLTLPRFSVELPFWGVSGCESQYPGMPHPVNTQNQHQDPIERLSTAVYDIFPSSSSG